MYCMNEKKQIYNNTSTYSSIGRAINHSVRVAIGRVLRILIGLPDGEQLGEVGLMIGLEHVVGGVPVVLVRIGIVLDLSVRDVDHAHLGGSDVVREVVIGCGRPRENLDRR